MNIIRTSLLCTALLATTLCAQGQSLQFTQFDALPLNLNPAFTGMFDGKVRAAVIYRNQWKSVTIPYTSVGISFDTRAVTFKNNDYMGVGGQVINAQGGDGNLRNFSGFGSVAYHKLFNYDSVTQRGCDVAIGVQGGYAQTSTDLSKLYFINNVMPTTPYTLGVGNSLDHNFINVGANFAQAISSKVNYTLGLALSNINQPNDPLLKKYDAQTGMDMGTIITAGANLFLSDRIALRSAFIGFAQNSTFNYIVGSEVKYRINRQPHPLRTSSVFIGGWYRTDEALMVNAGVEIHGIRIGAAYDYSIATLNNATNGNGGFEVMMRFMPPKLNRKVPVPAYRF